METKLPKIETTTPTFISHFINIASRHAEKTALISAQHSYSSENKITYHELLIQCLGMAAQLKEFLVAANYTPSEFPPVIAICLPASIPLFKVLLSTWFANSAFCIIDTNQSLDEVCYRLHNVRPTMLVTTRSYAKKLHQTLEDDMPMFDRGMGELRIAHDDQIFSVKTIDSEFLLSANKQSQTEIELPDIHQLAYIAHTSGSTGKGRPKGVAVSQTGLLGAMQTHIDVMRLTHQERFFQFSGLEFDAIIMEMMLAFGTGSCLVIGDIQDRYQLNNMAKIISEQRITSMIFTPKLLEAYEPTDFPSLQKIVITGESCTKPLLDKWRSIEIYIGFGTVETSIALLLCLYDGISVSIGGSVMGAMRYWLADEEKVVQVGSGEIIAAGEGLALGYIVNGKIDEALTSSRFIQCQDPDDSSKIIRVYRTGDLAERLGNGALLHKGRLDEQVKIAGVRVEPEGVAIQIKTLLDQFPELATRCVHVCAQPNIHGHLRLVAFIQPKEDSHRITLERLVSVLYGDQITPQATRPQRFYLLDPQERYITANGKTDRKKIVAGIDGYTLLSVKPKNLPRTDTEKRMHDIWQVVFDSQNIDINTSFEELGGYSLLFMILVRQIRSSWQIDPLAVSLPRPLTIASLSQHVIKIQYAFSALKWINYTKEDKPLVICCLPIDGSEDGFAQLAKHELFSQEYRFALLTPPTAKEEFSSIPEYACYMSAAIKLQSETKSVSLLGWSYGGLNAFAIASRLQIEKHPVSFCGLIDTPAPNTLLLMNPSQHLSAICALIKKTIEGYGCGKFFTIDSWHPEIESIVQSSPQEQINLLFKGVFSRCVQESIALENLQRCFEVLNAIQKNLLLSSNYQPQSSDVSLSIYTAQKPSLVSAHFRVEVTEWKKLIGRGQVVVRHFDDVDHFFIMILPAFLKQLQVDLRESVLISDLGAAREMIKRNLREGEYINALQLSNKLLSKESYEANDFALRARIYAELNRYEHALADIKVALQIDPKCICAHITNALVYQATGPEMSHAIDAIDMALTLMTEKHDDFAFALRIKAELLMQIPTQLANATRLYKAAITLEPNNASLLASFGLQLMLRGNYSASKVYLIQACKLHPQSDYYSALLREAENNTKENVAFAEKFPVKVERSAAPSVMGQFFNQMGAAFRSVMVADVTVLKDQLFAAAKSGELSEIRAVMAQGVLLSETDKNLRNVLHIASIQGHAPVVQLCLRERLNVCQYDGHGQTAAHLAAEHGHYDVIDLILQTLDSSQRLHLIHMPTVKMQDGKMIVHAAAHNPNPQVLNYCIEMGANPNSLTRFRFTPLHFASRCNHLNVVRCLVDTHQADPNLCNTLGYDAFEWAVRANSLESAVVMLPRYKNFINYYALLVSTDAHFQLLMQGDDAFYDQNTLDGFFPRDLDKAEMYYRYIYLQHENNEQPYLWALACNGLARCYQARGSLCNKDSTEQQRCYAQAIRFLNQLIERLRKDKALSFSHITRLKEITHLDSEVLSNRFQSLLDQLNYRIDEMAAPFLQANMTLSNWVDHHEAIPCLWDKISSKALEDVRSQLMTIYEKVLCRRLNDAEAELHNLLKVANENDNPETKIALTCLCLELLSVISAQKNDNIAALKLIMSLRGYLKRHELLIEKNTDILFMSTCQGGSPLQLYYDVLDDRFFSIFYRAKNVPQDGSSTFGGIRKLLQMMRLKLSVARESLHEALNNPRPSLAKTLLLAETSNTSPHDNNAEVQDNQPTTRFPSLLEQVVSDSRYVKYEVENKVASVDDLLSNIEQLHYDIASYHQQCLSIFEMLVQSVIEGIGEPSCPFSVCVSGSLANGLPCYYSDVEWFILIENDSESSRAFFRQVSAQVSMLMIGLGETTFDILPKGQSATRRGFSEDPSGLTPINQRGYELITTPQKLARQLLNFKDHPVEFTNMLLQTRFLLGHQELHRQYLEAVSSFCQSPLNESPLLLSQQIVLDLIEGYQNEFALRLDETREIEEKFFTVKRDIYRLLVLFVEAVSQSCAVGQMGISEKLEKLLEQGVISLAAKSNLSIAIALAYIVRNRAQHHYQEEFEGIFYEQIDAGAYLHPNPYLITETDRQILNRVYRTVIPVHKGLEELKEILQDFRNVHFDEAFLGDDLLKLARLYNVSSDVSFAKQSAAYHLRMYRAINPMDLDGLIETYKQLRDDPSTDAGYRCALQVYKRTGSDDVRHYDAGLTLALLTLRKARDTKEPADFDMFLIYATEFFKAELDQESNNQRYMLAFIYMSDFYLLLGFPLKAVMNLQLAKELIEKFPLGTVNYYKFGVGLGGRPEQEGLAEEKKVFLRNGSGFLNTQHWRSLIQISIRLSAAHQAAEQYDQALSTIDDAFLHFRSLLEFGYGANHDLYFDCMKQKAKIQQLLKQFDQMWLTLDRAMHNQLNAFEGFPNHKLFEAIILLLTLCFESKTHFSDMHEHLRGYLGYFDPMNHGYYRHLNQPHRPSSYQHYLQFMQHRFPDLIYILGLLYRHMSEVLVQVIRPHTIDDTLLSVLIGENTPKLLTLYCKEALRILTLLYVEPFPEMNEEVTEYVVMLITNMRVVCNEIVDAVGVFLETEEELKWVTQIVELNDQLDAGHVDEKEVRSPSGP